MGRIGKQQLVKLVAERAALSEAAAGRILQHAFDAITEELAKGTTVSMTGFGSWRTKVYTPRTGHHPRDGSPLDIPARTRVMFRAGSKLRQAVESRMDPAIFFGEGVGETTRVQGLLAQLFGADPETFHLEETKKRFRQVFGEAAEREAEEFFAAVFAGFEQPEEPERVDEPDEASDEPVPH